MAAGDVSARRTRQRRPRNADGSMTLFEHLKEFQVRLFRSVLGILAGCIVAYFFYDQIFAIVRRPFDLVVEEARTQGQTITLAVSGVTDAFTLQLEVVLIAGVVLSLPIWLYQLWRFLAPGLKSNERRWAVLFAAVATPLFLFGAWVAYGTMPNLLHLLLGFTPQNVANIINVNDYLGFIIQILLFFGIGALIPLVFVMLNFAGFLTGRGLLKQWRWLVIGVLTFAAVATPTADPFTMGMVAIPFLGVVVAAVLVMLLNDARRGRRRGADPLAGLSDDEASPTPEPVVQVDDLRPSRIDDDVT
ncbi:MAG TPA: twin-arginine translocase subunit TatC [Candidatus Nanopelagicales bacterium]|nr:twin-arginine translocase subunit TatC [Candidatus Nanopelagicales bacterium]